MMINSGGEKAEPVARKALVIGGASDFLMILGLMLFFSLAPDHTMNARIAIASNPLAFWSFFLIFLGAGAKAGMFPFHTWIPDAAQVMPASGFAAMPASLEKVLGIYFLFRADKSDVRSGRGRAQLHVLSWASRRSLWRSSRHWLKRICAKCWH